MQATVASNVHPTAPATMPVKQVVAMKYGERDSSELAMADLETGLRGGSDHGE